MYLIFNFPPPPRGNLTFFRKLKQPFDAEFQALQNDCFISIFFRQCNSDTLLSNVQ